MPTCSNSDLDTMVRHLYAVVTPSCANALRNLKFVAVGSNPIMDMSGNPGLFLNKSTKAGLLGILNRAREGDLEATKSDTIIVRTSAMTRIPLVYGVLIHEMGHAYCETTGAFPNTEKNAYIFETNWVCSMAADPNHPYAQAMKDGFKTYFAARIPAFRKDGVENLHLSNVRRYGLEAYA